MRKKIFIAQIVQESNSFNPVISGEEIFSRLGIREGNELVVNASGCGTTLGAMVDTLKKEDCEIFGGLSLRASSGGPMDAKLVDRFIQKAKQTLATIVDLDGVLISMHGATISTQSEDVCGDVLYQIRQMVGNDVPISVSFDLHANVTTKIVQNADYVCGYVMYPHLDLYQVGVRATTLLVNHLKGDKNVLVRAEIPVIAPAHAYNTNSGKLKALMDKGHEFVRQGKIVDFSVFQAQPWLDVSKLSATVIVIAKDEQTAIEVANDLAQDEYDLRKELQGEKLYTIPEVIQIALKNKSGKPIVISHSADSVNAGATGDSAEVLEHLLEYKDVLRGAVAIADLPSVEKAFSLGVGAVADFVLGATVAPNLTKPVKIEKAKVKSLHDGEFRMCGPQERGQLKNLNKVAVLEVGKIKILVAGNCGNDGDKAFFTSFGIEPEFCDIVAVKACTSFRAVYEKFAESIYNVESLGSAGTVLQKLPYKNRPSPLYPFEQINGFEKAKRYR